MFITLEFFSFLIHNPMFTTLLDILFIAFPDFQVVLATDANDVPVEMWFGCFDEIGWFIDCQ